MKQIEAQLQLQKHRLQGACERKVQALENLDAAEKEITEARMGVAILEFALQQINVPKEPDPPLAPGKKGKQS